MSGASANLLRHVQQLVEAHRITSLSDRQLLERFAVQRDEAAFALLVQRHGPMVLGVCRRLLGHEQDAEDAFQAVFLILARRAAAIRQADIGGFLYRVAYRLAVRARGQSVKRLRREQRAEAPPSADPVGDATWREVRQVVDEELQRLPEAPRSALVLCYLEGKTLEQAARLLGWSKSTLRRRLNQGRELLRRRLLARGLAPMAALTASLFAEETVSAALAGAVVRAAVSGTASPAIAALVAMGCSLAPAGKAKMATLVVLVVSLLGGVGVWRAESRMDKEPGERGRVSAPSNSLGALTRPRSPEAATTVEIRGRVLDSDGKPKSGVKLLLLDRKGKVKQLGATVVDGRFTVALAKDATTNWGHWLVAQAGGAAFDFLGLYRWKGQKPVELRLVKDHVIRGRVVNTEGKPIRGVRVAAEEIESFDNNSLDYFLAAWKNDKLDRSGREKIQSGAGALFAATTDADGRFVLAGIGAERTAILRLRGGGIADTSAYVVNRAGFDPKPYNQAFLDRIKGKRHGNWRWWMLSGPDVAIVAQSEKIIRGSVRDADTGKGRPGVVVRMLEDSEESLQFPPESTTDAQGRYEMHGIRKTKRYLLVVSGDKVAGYVQSNVWVEDTAGHQLITADIRVKKGVIITGKVIDGGTGKPIRGWAWPAVLVDNPFVKDYPKFQESIGLWDDNSASSNDDGVFRVVTIPGPVVLMGGPQDSPSPKYKRPVPDPKYPQYFSVQNWMSFRIRVHPETLGAHGGIPQGNFCKVLEIKPGVAVVEQDIVLERSKTRTVRIQDVEGKPLAGAWAAGFAPENYHPPHRFEEASCTIYGDLDEPKLLVFYHPEKKLVGARRLKGDEKEPIVVKLGPLGSIEGRLLDADGKALAQVAVQLRYRDREAEGIHRVIEETKQIVTDANGAFTFDAVIPELKFELSFRRGQHRFQRETKSADPAVHVEASACRDLGAIRLKQLPVGEQE